MTNTVHFTHGGREWVAKTALTEDQTRFVTHVKPTKKSGSWPTRDEHRAAVREYHALRQRA